jgi:hypothetical protein
MELIIKNLGSQATSTTGCIYSHGEGNDTPAVNYTYCFIGGQLNAMVWVGNDIVLEQRPPLVVPYA